MGRRRRISAFVVTGNKNGSAGIALGKAIEAKAALRKAKNRAGQKLLYIEIFNNHTGRFLRGFCVFICMWSDNKVRELIAVKVLLTSLLNTTVVAMHRCQHLVHPSKQFWN